VATDALYAGTSQFDVNQMETAVAARAKAVDQLSELINRDANAFTSEDLERVRLAHSKGKWALEKLLETRRTSWTAVTDLSQNKYVLKSFSRRDIGPDSIIDRSFEG
jgi:hypothetical protein